jgi:uncharacterized membrane protein
VKTNQTFTTKKIVVAALMAALTVVGSSLRITIPVDIAGTSSFHLGNIMCALSGLLLGPWLGGLAAGLGSAIYDMLNPLYISECWITFLLKGAYGLIAGLIALSGKKDLGYGKAVLASAAAAVTYGILYLAKGCFYDGMLLKGLEFEVAAGAVLATKIPATVFNAAVAVVGAPLLAMAIRTALRKSRLTLD